MRPYLKGRKGEREGQREGGEKIKKGERGKEDGLRGEMRDEWEGGRNREIGRRRKEKGGILKEYFNSMVRG